MIALLALVVVGALAAGALLRALQDQRLAESTRRVAQARGAAEVAADDLVTYWDPAAYDSLPVYPFGPFSIASALAPTRTSGKSGQFYGAIYRLSADLFLVDITGQDGGAGTRQRVGVLARLLPVDLPLPAALTGGSDVSLSGGALVTGAGSAPGAGWSRCLGAGPPPGVTGIRSPTAPGISGGSVLGSPPVSVDSTIAPATFGALGTASYASLAALAALQLPRGTYQAAPSVPVGGSVQSGDPGNWGGGSVGDPCADYLPVIHIAGGALLHAVRGQGILLVDGDLDLEGPVDFAGVMIVQGSLKVVGAAGSEVHIYGTVMTQHSTQVVGESVISYSKCFVYSSLSGISVAAPLRSRGWLQLY